MALKTGINIMHADLGAGDNRALRVSDRSQDGAAECLGHQWSCAEQEKENESREQFHDDSPMHFCG